MHASNPRAGRRPLALYGTAIVALASLGACADDPVRPTPPAGLKPQATHDTPIILTVTTKSGGIEVGSLRWAANQVTHAGTWIIRFDPKLARDTIALDKQLYLDYHARIEGPEPGGITLSGRDQHRVIGAPAGVHLRNVNVTKGNDPQGSAIWSGDFLVLEHSTIHGNRGAGAAIDSDGQYLIIRNSTISGNATATAAVEYEAESWSNIEYSTIANNAPGVGLHNEGGPARYAYVAISNSIIANNGSPLRNCTQYGLEFFEPNIVSDWSCGEVGMVVTDPMLMPLANNGGPGMTHAIPHTSPAYNVGAECFRTDQRHVVRDVTCDLGAFEFNDFTKATITFDQNTKVDAATGRALLTGTIRCTRDESFRLALELHQDQKVGKDIVDVHSASDIAVQCTTTAKPWSAAMALLPGEAWQAGAARATAATFQTPEWMTPASVASGVKISFTRR